MLADQWLHMVTRDDELHMDDLEFERLLKEKFEVDAVDHE